MTNKEAIKYLKYDGCIDCTHSPSSAYMCDYEDCTYKQAVLIAIKALEDIDRLKEFCSFSEEGEEEIEDLINNAPTVEPETKLVANVTFNKEEMGELIENAKEDILAQIERPQGEWIFVSRNCWKCPYCQELTNEGKNFCPNCGADMRGDKK